MADAAHLHANVVGRVAIIRVRAPREQGRGRDDDGEECDRTKTCLHQEISFGSALHGAQLSSDLASATGQKSIKVITYCAVAFYIH
jgi:hypothetical protein